MSIHFKDDFFNYKKSFIIVLFTLEYDYAKKLLLKIYLLKLNSISK